MQYVIVGLGNPGEEYANTRHNVGRMVLEQFRKKNDFPSWEADKSVKALVSKGAFGKDKIILLEPDNFMNVSGKSVAPFIKNAKEAERTIVVYDDVDLPLGTMKISFNRSSGGHKGVESIIKALKTREFARLRMGICPMTPGGKPKKPKGEDAILEFIVGPFKKAEQEVMSKAVKQGADALALILTEGREKATGEVN
ncbi:MAG: aminoacyl-tRNA hydrolase [Candidatus Yonathbacteria bacterium RIFOXYC2_FULL_47_9]|nr:MAG: aminoacyl-tRNA hydrolase [Candidatus Yonathbacteria bacterium RIFOXYC2_FULL_47_9]HAT68116.1 aminoacyl-tRNA hydrolase [Candidatus Yonathbacteria bacterium]